jgi:hypothetical protein
MEEYVKFEINRKNVEGVVNMDNPYFPPHFFGVICGWPSNININCFLRFWEDNFDKV